MMIRNSLFAAVVAAPALALAAPAQAQSASFSPAQRDEIGTIVRDYLIAHPEVLQEAMSELEKRQNAAESAKQKLAVQQNASLIFDSPRNVVLGNPKGDVTLVEFFDYNCAFCKRAMSDMVELIKADPNLRFVLKEFPVLGEGSVEAAHVAVAARMQDPTGKKYLDFHLKLLGGRGEANQARALAAAKDAGFDMTRLQKDMASPEINATLAESFKIAEAVGLNGTPSYVLGDEAVIGAVGLEALRQKINTVRCGKAAC